MTATIAAVSQSQSLAAIRNFVRASISCITYARGLCSDSSYESHTFLGMSLMHMVPASTEAITISEWIEKGAFDALNRNYLKEMALCVHNGDCTEQLESYCFGFTYTPDGQHASLTLSSTQQRSGDNRGRADALPMTRNRRCSKEEVQQALLGILTRLLEVVESLPPLVSERVVTMRLTYYDAVTPEAYQPPCFAPASERMIKFYKDEQKSNVSMGTMDTSHHLFSVSVHHPLLAHVRNDMLAQKLQQGLVTATKRIGDEVVDPLQKPQTLPSAVSASESTWADHEGSTALSKNTSTTAKGMDPTVAVPRRMTAITSKCVPAPQVETLASAQDADCGVLNARRGYRIGALATEDVRKLPPLCQLLGKTSLLRRSELSYLLLVSFTFSRCAPSVQSGGWLTFADLHGHLRESCAIDISTDAAAAVMRKLVADGYLREVSAQCDESDAGSRKVARNTNGACAAGEVLGRDESSLIEAGATAREAAKWAMVSDPPLAVLTALLAQRQVVDLLSPTVHVALTELRAKMETHHNQTRTGDAARQRQCGGSGANPRISFAESRKRDQTGAFLK